jgi:hypothetical protein
MTQPTEYLLAAAVSVMRSADNSGLETLPDLKNRMESEFSVSLDSIRLNYMAKRLEKYGFIQITSDQYAGDYITPLTGWGVSYRLNKIKESGASQGLAYVLERGSRLMERAFSNSQFWKDLDAEIAASEIEGEDDEISVADVIPASDRLVSLSHNEFKEIDEPTGALLEELERDNGIPDQPGLKERIVGQIRAGRELLKAGEFVMSTFKATMIAGLEELKSRYVDHAISAAAGALLTLILHILGIPGF